MIARKYKLPSYFFREKGHQKSEVVSKGLFSVKIYSSSLNFSRFAVVVSSQVANKAHLRNKIRRMFYDLLRKEKIFSIKGKDFVFYVKSEAIKGLKEDGGFAKISQSIGEQLDFLKNNLSIQ